MRDASGYLVLDRWQLSREVGRGVKGLRKARNEAMMGACGLAVVWSMPGL